MSGLYGARWQRERAEFLRAHPRCVMCKARGIRCQATVVDHKQPHQGDLRLFWDKRNWQALCKACHDVKTARVDGGGGHARGGLMPGGDANGLPTDPRHPWAATRQ